MVFEQRSQMRRALGILGASTVLSSMALPVAALAQSAPAPAPAPDAAAADNGTGGLGEIVVTATRKAESVQKVPISIQALGAEKLEQHQVSTFADYASMLPSVSFSGLGPGQSEVYFRGIAVDGGALSTSGTYLDDVPISQPGRMPEVHIYDIERVEALSGPQGTLYGAGSLAGTLRIITNKAKIGKFEAGTDVQVDAYGKGAAGAMVEGFVNIPVNEHIAVRMMGFYDHEGGYIDNTHGTYTYQLGDDDPNTTYTVDNATLVQKNYNPVDSYGGRINATIEAARLRFRPILMTSFAFIMGVIPMAISTGAGANSRHAIGTGVIGGMLFATLLGLLMIPVFFVVVRRMLGDKLDEPSKEFMERQRDAESAHRPDR